jgi:hypothetical protein
MTITGSGRKAKSIRGASTKAKDTGRAALGKNSDSRVEQG